MVVRKLKDIKKKIITRLRVKRNARTKFEGNNFVGYNSDVRGASIGRGTYIGARAKLACSMIGRFNSIGHNVHCVLSDHPLGENVSTHPAFYNPRHPLMRRLGLAFEVEKAFNPGPAGIVIENDVWIGDDVKIFAGVNIGNGSVVGVGSIVTKDVPPYSIVAGVPARVLRYRFALNEIRILQSLQWWNWSCTELSERAGELASIKNFSNEIARK